MRLVTRNTYEAVLVETANRKLGLEHALSGSEGGSWLSRKEVENAPPQDKEELERLLRAGARDIFLKEAEGESEFKRFSESDIEQILASGTRVAHDQGGLAEGSTFSKAAFVPSEAEAAFDIDDPDFWSKVLPAVEERADEPLAKRQPKQAQRFGLVLDTGGRLEDLDIESPRDSAWEPPPDAKQIEESRHRTQPVNARPWAYTGDHACSRAEFREVTRALPKALHAQPPRTLPLAARLPAAR